MKISPEGAHSTTVNEVESAQSVPYIHYQKQLEQIIKMDKVETHLHLGGAWPLEFIRNLAEPKDFSDMVHILENVKSGLDYKEIFKVFPLIEKIVNTDQKVESGVKALCKELAEDNVTRVEIRTGLKDLGSGLEGYLDAVLKGIKSGKSEYGIKAGLVLSLRRDTSKEIAEKTIDLAIKYRDEGIVGIDLSGDSTKGDGKAAVKAIQRAKEAGFPVTLHIGESPEEKEEQQLWELSAIVPDRIGHGVHLCDEAVVWMKEHRTPLEMCLSSSVMAGMLPSAEEHPGLKLLKDNHPVMICTDDPLIFQTTLSEECALAARILKCSVEVIRALQTDALEHCFVKG